MAAAKYYPDATLDWSHREFDWDDLMHLVRRGTEIDGATITADCARGFAFLAALTDEEQTLARDQYQREREVWERLKSMSGDVR